MELRISIYHNIRTALSLLTIFSVYYVSVLFFLPFAFEKGDITPIIPAVGIAFSAVFLFGYKIWPAIGLATFAANLWFFISDNIYTVSTSVTISFIISTVTTAEVLTGFFLVKKLNSGMCKIENVKQVLQFSGLTLVL